MGHLVNNGFYAIMQVTIKKRVDLTRYKFELIQAVSTS